MAEESHNAVVRGMLKSHVSLSASIIEKECSLTVLLVIETTQETLSPLL